MQFLRSHLLLKRSDEYLASIQDTSAVEEYYDFEWQMGGRPPTLNMLWDILRPKKSTYTDLDPAKDNREAAKIRESGNEAYRDYDFEQAIRKYNEALCWAEPGSAEMGLIYGNRSAVCYATDEYHFCLLNIALAKQNRYPERLRSKLESRERHCRQHIAAGRAPETVPLPRLPVNVETNPRIPFLAKGLKMEVIPEYGRAMVAEQDFQPGSVILQEKAMVLLNTVGYRLLRCDHCAELNGCCLIPCPTCVSVMFCSEECRDKNWKLVHRFECGVFSKLIRGSSELDLAPRLFFYGLSLFGDDVDEMMEFYKTLPGSGVSNPLDVDYSNYDPLEEFKKLMQIELPDTVGLQFLMIDACKNTAIFLRNSSLRALINRRAKEKFMVNMLVHFMRLIDHLAIAKWKHNSSAIFPIASICNHSCDPQVFAVHRCGVVKLIAIRPIRKGEQVFISYGPVWYKNKQLPRNGHSLSFECQCPACNEDTDPQQWLSSGKKLDAAGVKSISKTLRVSSNTRVSLADRLNMLQQLVKRYAPTHPNDLLCTVLSVYWDWLGHAVDFESEALWQAKALAAANAALGQQQMS